MRIVLCDIDGVLAEIGHRLRFMRAKDYDAFYSADEMVQDKLINDGKTLLDILTEKGRFESNYPKTFLVTGRPFRTSLTTEMWLAYHHIHWDNILYRDDGDYRPSPEVKVEHVESLELNFGDDEIYFIDDDPENVKAVCEAFPQIIGLTFGVGRL